MFHVIYDIGNGIVERYIETNEDLGALIAWVKRQNGKMMVDEELDI